MRSTSRIIGTIVGVTLLATTISACEEKEITDALSSATATQSSESPQENAGTGGAEDDSMPAEDDTAEPSGEATLSLQPEDSQSGEPGGEETWTGPGEDPATMELGSLVDYETLPGDCLNDVPMPETIYDPGEVTVENLPGDECMIIIDSKGDSPSVADGISQQLSDAGFDQTSSHSGDNGPEAKNVFSYVTNTHEVFVTVTQNGASGVLIHYALTDPARANG